MGGADMNVKMKERVDCDSSCESEIGKSGEFVRSWCLKKSQSTYSRIDKANIEANKGTKLMKS